MYAKKGRWLKTRRALNVQKMRESTDMMKTIARSDSVTLGTILKDTRLMASLVLDAVVAVAWASKNTIGRRMIDAKEYSATVKS